LHPPCRAVGPTIQAVLEYLVSLADSDAAALTNTSWLQRLRGSW
jgi:hypothetical protein